MSEPDPQIELTKELAIEHFKQPFEDWCDEAREMEYEPMIAFTTLGLFVGVMLAAAAHELNIKPSAKVLAEMIQEAFAHEMSEQNG